MNFASNSPPKPTNYPHRPSYHYPSHTHPHTRSPHHTARTPFNSHGPQPYHPRLITTPTPPQPPQPPQPPPLPQHSPNNTHNHIKKNYHFSAKSSELFIKKKPMNNLPRNTRFDAMPTLPHPHSHTHPPHPPPPHAHVQLLTLTRPTISFSSQHTPQSFIATNPIHHITHQHPHPHAHPHPHTTAIPSTATTATTGVVTNATPNNSPHTLSTVSTTSPNIITECKNKISNNRKSRWNSKPDHIEHNKNRNRNSRDRDRDKDRDRRHSYKTHSHSRSRSRSRTANSNSNSNLNNNTAQNQNQNQNQKRISKTKCKNGSESEDIDMSISDTTEPNNNIIMNNNESNNKYIISSDIHIFPPIKYKSKSKNTKRNFAKEEINSKQKRYTTQLKAYMLRNTKRKRIKNRHIKKRNKLAYNNNKSSDHSDMNMADDENNNDMINNYNIDINDSDFAIYEPPFKKPKFMKKIKKFVREQSIPKCVVNKIHKINNNLLISRNKKRKQREEYVLIDRAQSNHWNILPTKCWFYRCVHMLEGHVSTMCSSPEFAGGVSYPLKPLNEIEKKLSRIHPLPTLIYKRLFKTLYNLSNLIRTYPTSVKWDRNKLESIFSKAIRKQLQMKNIYNFNNNNCEFIEYDFTPFKLPQYERNNVSFYLNNEKHNNENSNNNIIMDKCESIEIGTMLPLNRTASQMSMTIDGGIDDDEEEENDDEDEGEEEQIFDDQRRCQSVTPSDIKDLTPALSLTSNMNTPQPPTLPPPTHANINKLITNNNKVKHHQIQTPTGTISSVNVCKMDDLQMETHLNMDLVRKTKVTFNLPSEDLNNIPKFEISPKIEKLVEMNIAQIELKNKCTNISEVINDIKNDKKNDKKNNINDIKNDGTYIRNKNQKYTWFIETLNSNDESIDAWDLEKKRILSSIFLHNGVYGPIKGIGLEPTYFDLPTYYEYDLYNGKIQDEIRLPSIYYLISKYIDSTNIWYIKMLLKYFNVKTYKIDDEKDDTTNNNNEEINSKFIVKYLCKHPKALKHTFIGTSKDCIYENGCYVYSTIMMEIYIIIHNKQYYIRLRLNENKRHKLLCVLLRIKNKYKYKHHTLCIPQPPPPPIGSENNEKIKIMNTICVNYNWNGFCEATYCNKKHICCSCGNKHPARVCSKQCIDYNWAKCQRICPKNKLHICSQCGDNKHPAWRCQYLHKSVTERYYAIYKTKKLRNGYFKLLEKKEKKKNIEWINRKYKSPLQIQQQHQHIQQQNTNININTNQQRHHNHTQNNRYNNQKGKKRSNRK